MVIPQLEGGPGFQNCSYRVRIFLDSAGVLKTPKENPPAVEAERTKIHEADRKAKAYVAGELLQVVHVQNFAKNMFKALETAFAKKSNVTQNLLWKQLNRLKLEKGKSMRAPLMAFEVLIRQPHN